MAIRRKLCYISPLFQCFIVLDFQVKTLQVKAIEFHRIDSVDWLLGQCQRQWFSIESALGYYSVYFETMLALSNV